MTSETECQRGECNTPSACKAHDECLARDSKPRIVTLPTVASVQSMLLKIVEEIERGDYGDVFEGAVVLNGNKLELFGLGNTDSTTAHYLFCCAAQKMQNPLMGIG